VLWKSTGRHEAELFLLHASCWFLDWHTLRPWRWMWYSRLKCWLTLTRLHGVISQKIELITVNTLRTLNPTKDIIWVPNKYWTKIYQNKYPRLKLVCPGMKNKTVSHKQVLVPTYHSHWPELGSIFLPPTMGLSDHLSSSRFLTLHTSPLKKFLWNIGVHLQDCMVSKPRRSQSEWSLLWNLKTYIRCSLFLE
jgi:hypothetical protein